ncbi:hypothetical protein GDO86_002348 [Hymenochirus boettgeri]|uniref:Cardiomyopathy-associated protein 5 n=1 Tax=Hymenochirus boettgeri TaxID=247094 RepID=A0A8T2KHM6_9PIPI|nr:hypothetical protein GDO86_002348 [Hymenochirus boettgeri]
MPSHYLNTMQGFIQVDQKQIQDTVNTIKSPHLRYGNGGSRTFLKKRASEMHTLLEDAADSLPEQSDIQNPVNKDTNVNSIQTSKEEENNKPEIEFLSPEESNCVLTGTVSKHSETSTEHAEFITPHHTHNASDKTNMKYKKHEITNTLTNSVSENEESLLFSEDENSLVQSVLEINSDEPHDTQSHVFSIVSDGSEILNIHAPELISSVDQEASCQMEDKLEYLDENPMLIPKQVCVGDEITSNIDVLIEEDKGKSLTKTDLEMVSFMNPPDKAAHEVDYFEKFTLIDDKVPNETSFAKSDLILQEGHANVTQCGPYYISETTVDDLYMHGYLDESFYGSVKDVGLESSQREDFSAQITNGIEKDTTPPVKTKDMSLFDEEEGVLEKSLLFPTSYPINPELLEEPPALAFLYKDLYEEAKGTRTKEDNDQSDVESTTSVGTFHSRISDDDGTGIYFEKYNLKDEIPSNSTKPYINRNNEVKEIFYELDDLHPDYKFTPIADSNHVKDIEKLPGNKENNAVQSLETNEPVDDKIHAYQVLAHNTEEPKHNKCMESGQEKIKEKTLRDQIHETISDGRDEELEMQDIYLPYISKTRASPEINFNYVPEILEAQTEEDSRTEEENKIPPVFDDINKIGLDVSKKKEHISRGSIHDEEITKPEQEESQHEAVNGENTEDIEEGTNLGFQTSLGVIPEEEDSFCFENADETAESLDYVIITQDDLQPCENEICENRLLGELGRDDGYDLPADLEQEAKQELEDLGFEVIEPLKPPADLSETNAMKPQSDTYCYTCKSPFSSMEKILGDHKDHNVTSLDDAANDMTINLEDLLEKLKESSMKTEDFVSRVESMFNDVERNYTQNEKILEGQQEKMNQKVVGQRTDKSHKFEELKKMKMEYLYDQMVSFQQNVDSAREILERAEKEIEEKDPVLFLSLHDEINTRLLTALESTLSLEKMPSAFSLFEHHAGNSSQVDQKQIQVPQTPNVKSQEPNSATSTSIAVYWTTDQDDVIEFFQVYCMEEPEQNHDENVLLEEYRVTVKESFCILEDLEPDKCYSVWVMAVNYTGCSLPSDKAPFRTAPSIPVIKAEECTVCWDMAIIRWSTAHPESTESFTLEWCKQYPSEGEGLRSIAGIKNQQFKVSLQPNENYFFYVRAASASGTSEQSEAALISTKGTRFHLMRDTAHPVLELSTDGSVISISEQSEITGIPLVLGEVLPASGCHYWEMTVTRCNGYSIGATFQPSREHYGLEEDSTSWCMQCCSTAVSYSYKFLHNEVFSEVCLTKPPDRIGILLDYRTGRLSFYNVPKGQVLYTFRNRFKEAAHPTFALEVPGELQLHTGIELPPFVRNS